MLVLRRKTLLDLLNTRIRAKGEQHHGRRGGGAQSPLSPRQVGTQVKPTWLARKPGGTTALEDPLVQRELVEGSGMEL